MTSGGVCAEATWPYDVAKYAVSPPDKCFDEALEHQTLNYKNVSHTLFDIRSCLASGFPVVFGFCVYDGFEGTGPDGIVNMPTKRESVRGWHAVTCVGYFDDTREWIVRNSYGPDWGDHGYFYMPYEYLLSGPELASEIYVIDAVEDPTPTPTPTPTPAPTPTPTPAPTPTPTPTPTPHPHPRPHPRPRPHPHPHPPHSEPTWWFPWPFGFFKR
jgi:hypothetical protein